MNIGDKVLLQLDGSGLSPFNLRDHRCDTASLEWTIVWAYEGRYIARAPCGHVVDITDTDILQRVRDSNQS
jgi:hypothetical protein